MILLTNNFGLIPTLFPFTVGGIFNSYVIFYMTWYGRSMSPSFPLLPDPMVNTFPSRSLQAPTSPLLRGSDPGSFRLGNLPPRPPLPPPHDVT